MGKVFEQKKVVAQRGIEKRTQSVDKVYYRQDSYWYTIPRQVFTNLTPQKQREFRLPLERDFVPPTFFDNLSPPLLSSLSSESEYFPHLVRAMAYARPPTIEFSGDGSIGVRAFVNWIDSWFRSMGAEFAGDTPEAKRICASQI